MNAHWLLAAGFAGMAVAIFFLGWSARIMRVEWRDDRALRAAEARYERHTHRKGDPLPRAGHLALIDPAPEMRASSQVEPPWLFAGGWDQGPVAESAEYELLTQTAEQPGHTCDNQGRFGLLSVESEGCRVCQDLRLKRSEHDQTAVQPASSVEGEPPIDTGELLAITDRVESWIAQWTAQGNVDRHTIQAGD